VWCARSGVTWYDDGAFEFVISFGLGMDWFALITDLHYYIALLEIVVFFFCGQIFSLGFHANSRSGKLGRVIGLAANVLCRLEDGLRIDLILRRLNQGKFRDRM
jgi:hypothetical protein